MKFEWFFEKLEKHQPNFSTIGLNNEMAFLHIEMWKLDLFF